MFLRPEKMTTEMVPIRDSSESSSRYDDMACSIGGRNRNGDAARSSIHHAYDPSNGNESGTGSSFYDVSCSACDSRACASVSPQL